LSAVKRNYDKHPGMRANLLVVVQSKHSVVVAATKENFLNNNFKFML